MSKALTPGHASRVVTIRLTGPQLARLRELGGAAWVRQQIEAGPGLARLAERVARLNRDVGEIGPGMLASLVDEARGLLP